MATTISTFWYEMDRSRCLPKFQRNRESYIERLVTIIKTCILNPTLHLKVYVESNEVKHEIITKFLNDEIDSSIFVVKPLCSWPKHRNFSKNIQIMLDSFKGTTSTPETFSADYVCLNLSKIDAVIEHAKLVSASYKNHIWIDGGYRWDISVLQKQGILNWNEDKIYFSECKPMQLMGGVFGGTINQLNFLNEQINSRISFHIAKAKPFTDQNVYSDVAKLFPDKFVRVPLYSQTKIGNYLFGSAVLERMLPAVLEGSKWSPPVFSKSEMYLLAIIGVFIAIVIIKKLKK